MTSTLAFARFKQKPSWPFLAITTSIGMLVGHIFHAMVNRIAKVEDDYYEYLATVSHEMRTIMNGVLVMGKMYKNKKQADGYGLPREQTDMQDPVMDIRKIMKDVENFSYSHMTWKERKKIENRKVVSLGGKPPKNQRLPLSVARPMMKKQKEREQKMLQERLILGRFGGKLGGSSKRSVGKHKPEDRGLKSSEGRFKNGILDVRHLLNSAPSRDHDTGTNMSSKGKMKGGKMKQGKKGAGKKHH